MELENLRDLYIDELKDLYSAEKQLLKALPRMAKAASDASLRDAFTTHLAQTERQVARLEEIFESLGASPRGKKCVGMEGLIEEGSELIEEDPEPEVLDAGLISKAQHIEHYEIAGYGTVRTYASVLGEDSHVRLLQETLDEEGEADKLLTHLAESSINVEAAMPDDESESDARDNGRGSSSRSERAMSRQPSKEKSRARSRTSARRRESEATAD
jgi:ferritin-like metal-binding protein YciE